MKQVFVLILSILLITGCSKSRMELPTTPMTMEEKKTKDNSDIKTNSYRKRNRLPANQSRYEGSLWKDEASWGNLLRDHRARFSGDLVKITDLQDVISVPKSKEQKAVAPKTALAAAGEQTAGQIADVLEAVSGMSKAEEEQNEVMASLRSISAYVQSVLPNGNMVIVGEKVDYRQQNTVRYVTKIKGIIRPSDVNEKNEVPAIKLARFEPIIKRQMLAKNLRSLSPVLGPKKTSIFDRLSHIATPTKTTSPVKTK